MTTEVLFLGASGYIGGSALIAVARNPNSNLQIHALIRKKEHEPLLRAAGVSDVTISADNDSALIQRLVAESDLIVESVNSFDVDLAHNLIEGLKTRKRATGRLGTLIHISGSASVIDNSRDGKWVPTTKIWTDDEEDVHHFPADRPPSSIDVLFLKESDAGHFNLFILNAPVVYGEGSGPVSRHSSFFLLLLQLYEDGQKPFFYGEGSNMWTMVHIQDVASAFKIIFGLAYKSAQTGLLLTGSAYSRYFIVNTSRITVKYFTSLFAKVLHEKGVSLTEKPSSVPADKAEENLFTSLLSSNLVVEGRRLSELGWSPTVCEVDEVELTRNMETAVDTVLHAH